MPASTVASVHQLAAELLDKCEQVLATTVGGIPPSVFLSPGLPALDRQCDTLCVYETAPSVNGAGETPSFPGASLRFAAIMFIGLSVQAVRCVPIAREKNGVWKYPTDEQLTEAAEKVMEDGWALWNGVVSELRDGDLFETPCQAVEFVSLTPLDPQGGMAGWTLALAVDLQGYDVAV